MDGELWRGAEGVELVDVIDRTWSKGRVGGIARGFTEIECRGRTMIGEVVEIVVDITGGRLVFFGVLEDVDVGFSVTFGHLEFWGEEFVQGG